MAGIKIIVWITLLLWICFSPDISPLCHNLFALYEESQDLWYAPNHVFKITEETSIKLHYRMRWVGTTESCCQNTPNLRFLGFQIKKINQIWTDFFFTCKKTWNMNCEILVCFKNVATNGVCCYVASLLRYIFKAQYIKNSKLLFKNPIRNTRENLWLTSF